MGGPRTVEPPGPQRGMVTDDSSAGTLSRQFYGANGARSKNGMHPRREYNLLASEVPEGGRANAGGTGSKAGYGAMANQDRTDREGRGTKPCRVHSLHNSTTESGPRQGYPLNGRARLTHAATKGGKERGTHHPAVRAHDVQRGERDGIPKHGSAGPRRAARTRTRKGGPSPSSAHNPCAVRRGMGTGHMHPPRTSQGCRKGGIPPNGSVRSQRTSFQ